MPRGDTAAVQGSVWVHPGKCQCIVRSVGDELPADSGSLQSRESRSLCSAVSIYGLVIKHSSDPSREGFFCVLVASPKGIRAGSVRRQLPFGFQTGGMMTAISPCQMKSSAPVSRVVQHGIWGCTPSASSARPLAEW